MKRAVSLSALVIVAIAITSRYGSYHLVEASQWWSLSNQMMVEERPYTTPKNIQTPDADFERSTINQLLVPDVREMQRYCDGQCFYAPADCDHTKYKCSVILSVAMHNSDVNGDIYCDFFGANYLRESFCYKSAAQQAYRNVKGKDDRFFTITLYRTLGPPKPGDNPSSSCPKKWKQELGRRCRRTEFVAVSFVKTNPLESQYDLNPHDLWYVCTIDENSKSRVTTWYGVTVNHSIPQLQLHDTAPRKSAGMGVVFSKVEMDEEVASMGCQFVIQESNMTLPEDLKSVPENPYLPANAAVFGNEADYPITVKLASGYVDRDEDNGDIIRRPFFRSNKDFSYYTVYQFANIKPQNNIRFKDLEVKLINPSKDANAEGTKEAEARDAIELIKSKCDHPEAYNDSYIACYPPNHQPNCIHTGRCAVMFIVEIPRSDISFKTIKAAIYGIIPDHKALRKARRPMGFASVGFSFDDHMGRDVVFTCHADGPGNVNLFVSINYEHANIYPGKVSYNHFFYNSKSIGSANNSTILCEWEMNTHFVVNMFAYEPDYRECIRPGESEKLEYNFVKEHVRILLAAGNRNYPGGTIVHHDFAQVLTEYFSRDLFLQKVDNGTGDGTSWWKFW